MHGIVHIHTVTIYAIPLRIQNYKKGQIWENDVCKSTPYFV